MSEENIASKPNNEAEIMAKWSEGLLADPETRGSLFALVKQKYPDAAIPEFDVKNDVVNLLKAEREEREKLQKEFDKAQAEAKIIAERNKALAQTGLKEEDIPEIEKLMQEGSIYKYETAANYLKQSRQLASGSTTEGRKPEPQVNPVAEAKEKFNGDIRAWAKAGALEGWRSHGTKAA